MDRGRCHLGDAAGGRWARLLRPVGVPEGAEGRPRLQRRAGSRGPRRCSSSSAACVGHRRGPVHRPPRRAHRASPSAPSSAGVSLALLGQVHQLWQLYLVDATLAVGYACCFLVPGHHGRDPLVPPAPLGGAVDRVDRASRSVASSSRRSPAASSTTSAWPPPCPGSAWCGWPWCCPSPPLIWPDPASRGERPDGDEPAPPSSGASPPPVGRRALRRGGPQPVLQGAGAGLRAGHDGAGRRPDPPVQPGQRRHRQDRPPRRRSCAWRWPA